MKTNGLNRKAAKSAPEVFLAYVAAKTSQIRLGHGVTLTPHRYNHAIRIAERIATLDILSDGRVNWGSGKSSSAVEKQAFENDELRWAVDVRPAAQYATGHVPGAVNIEFESLPLRYAELPRGEQVLVTCDRGEVSRMAARLLVDLDFQSVAILDGGVEAWRYRDLPLHEER